jgi:hypothetical protein
MRPIRGSRRDKAALRPYGSKSPLGPYGPLARLGVEHSAPLETLGPPPTYLRTHLPKGPEGEGGELPRSTTHRRGQQAPGFHSLLCVRCKRPSHRAIRALQ